MSADIRRLVIIAVTALVLTLLIFAVPLAGWLRHIQSQTLTSQLVCEHPVHGCSIPGAGKLSFDHSPEKLKPFMVRLEKPMTNEVYAEFAMQGMEMGLNRYRFIKVADGVWQATVYLPICIQNRHDWVMRLQVSTWLTTEVYLMRFTAD